MNSFLCLLIVVLSMMISVWCLAGNDVAQPLPDGEKNAIKAFFDQFKEAFNTKDLERVKKMSGDTWGHWSKAINEGKFGSIEIMDITIGKQTNVVARCVAVDEKNRAYPAQVVFTMRLVDGVYSIAKMRFPQSERRSLELHNGIKMIENLIEAINDCNLDLLKDQVTFGDVSDFEGELSARGLSWIKEAMDNQIKIPKKNLACFRDGKDMTIGRLFVPGGPGGTNAMRKLIFKDLKIDRAAPREETKDEFLKRFEKEKEVERIKYQAEKAERERKKNEEALKIIQKRIK